MGTALIHRHLFDPVYLSERFFERALLPRVQHFKLYLSKSWKELCLVQQLNTKSRCCLFSVNKHALASVFFLFSR